jgi:hypothetical protein
MESEKRTLIGKESGHCPTLLRNSPLDKREPQSTVYYLPRDKMNEK